MVAGLGIALAACSGGGATASPPPPATQTPSVTPTEAASPTATDESPSPTGSEIEIETSSSDFGEIIVDSEGRTLYLFTNDTQGAGTSVCNGDCALAWPPLLVDEGQEAAADDEVTGELGTAMRDDGTAQVTLNGWPLYYFQADAAAGDTNGQGVGDVWWVVDPEGEAIME